MFLNYMHKCVVNHHHDWLLLCRSMIKILQITNQSISNLIFICTGMLIIYFPKALNAPLPETPQCYCDAHARRNSRDLKKPPKDPRRLSVDVQGDSGGVVQQKKSFAVRRSASANMQYSSSRLVRGSSNISDSSHSGAAAPAGVMTISEDPNILQHQRNAAGDSYHGQQQCLPQQNAAPSESSALANISENECGGPSATGSNRKVPPRQSSGLLLHPLGLLGSFDEHVPMKWEALLLALGHTRGTADSGSLMNSLVPAEPPPPAEMRSEICTIGGGNPGDFLGDCWAWHNIEASSVVDPVTGKRVRACVLQLHACIMHAWVGALMSGWGHARSLACL